MKVDLLSLVYFDIRKRVLSIRLLFFPQKEQKNSD